MTLDDVWKNVQSALRTEIGEGAFKNWIAPMALVSCEDGLAVLSAPTLFFGNWVSRNYGNRVCALLTTYGQSTSRLEFCLATSPAKKPLPKKTWAQHRIQHRQPNPSTLRIPLTIPMIVRPLLCPQPS